MANLTKHKYNLEGQIFEKWTVLNRDTMRKNGQTYWFCRCMCESVSSVSQTHLLTGHSKGCRACSHPTGKNSKLWKGAGDISGNFLYSLKNNAKSRNIDLSVTGQELWDLFINQNKKCALSGMPISLKMTRFEDKSNSTASIDRINSNEGYTLKNVQWVHKDINFMKQSYSQDYFVSLCESVTKNQTVNKMNNINHSEMVKVLIKKGNIILSELTANDVNLLHMAVGISGESGELLDAIKKRAIYRKDLDLENVIEELGDLEFYLEGIRQGLGLTREQCLEANIKKLGKRYEGMRYSDKAAHDRADKQ